MWQVAQTWAMKASSLSRTVHERWVTTRRSPEATPEADAHPGRPRSDGRGREEHTGDPRSALSTTRGSPGAGVLAERRPEHRRCNCVVGREHAVLRGPAG